MLKQNKKEFNKITKKIRNNHEFNKLQNEIHHGINRYEHCIRVAKYSYSALKLFRLNYYDGTIGAMLHDFYLNDKLKNYSEINKLCVHPREALSNSIQYYHINDLEKNIINSHMYPLNIKERPKYKESWVVSIVDKMVSLYEIIRFKSMLKLNIYLLFVINCLFLKIY